MKASFVIQKHVPRTFLQHLHKYKNNNVSRKALHYPQTKQFIIANIPQH